MTQGLFASRELGRLGRNLVFEEDLFENGFGLSEEPFHIPVNRSEDVLVFVTVQL